MTQIIAISYLVGIAIFLFLMVKIFIFLIKKNFAPKALLELVLVAMVADILSTIYFVYILGFGWIIEGNTTVRQYGESIGHLNALLLNHALLFLILYLFGIVLKKIPHGLKLIYGIFIMLFSYATITNIIFTTLLKVF